MWCIWTEILLLHMRERERQMGSKLDETRKAGPVQERAGVRSELQKAEQKTRRAQWGEVSPKRDSLLGAGFSAETWPYVGTALTVAAAQAWEEGCVFWVCLPLVLLSILGCSGLSPRLSVVPGARNAHGRLKKDGLGERTVPGEVLSLVSWKQSSYIIL